jgi:hypothetical protein
VGRQELLPILTDPELDRVGLSENDSHREVSPVERAAIQQRLQRILYSDAGR